MSHPTLAIIGGSGLYSMDGLENVKNHVIDTPFGATSSPIITGLLENNEVAFVARHGVGHTLLPAEVPYRANVFALKTLGVERILSVSAVGSLREDFAPLDVVIPDQIFDRTKARPSTFFGDGLVAHIDFADPFCQALSQELFSACQRTDATIHFGATLVVMEGPQFSTRAESHTYRKLGFDVIGMTALPEAKLAREAEMCYATVAFVTDYDVWHSTHGSVTSEMVAATIQQNTGLAQGIIRSVVQETAHADCSCHASLRSALLTNLDLVPEHTLNRLGPIVEKYRTRVPNL